MANMPEHRLRLAAFFQTTCFQSWRDLGLANSSHALESDCLPGGLDARSSIDPRFVEVFWQSWTFSGKRKNSQGQQWHFTLCQVLFFGENNFWRNNPIAVISHSANAVYLFIYLYICAACILICHASRAVRGPRSSPRSLSFFLPSILLLCLHGVSP